MSAEFLIDVQRGMVFSKATGVLSLDVAFDHMDRLSHNPDFKPGFNQLFDFRQATDIRLSEEEIREIARRDIFSADSRRAFLVADELQFGLGRMFATYRQMAGEKGIRIFTDAEAARAWVFPPDET